MKHTSQHLLHIMKTKIKAIEIKRSKKIKKE